MSEELKQFDISVDDIKLSEELFDNVREAIDKMRLATFKDNFEVVLNNNLIECKEIKTQFRTILGCRISYDNLYKNVSFIVREDIEPSYEELQQQLKDKDEKISKVKNYCKEALKELLVGFKIIPTGNVLINIEKILESNKED